MKKLGFGLMRLPLINTEDNSSIDIERFKNMVDEFMKAGGTYFDTAYFYHSGCSETAFREAVSKRYPREAYTVTDKMPMSNIKEEAELQKIFDEQMERCGVEYFDYYWLHALNQSNYILAEKIHAFDFIVKKKAEGKIRHIGFSFHDTPEVLDTILTDHPEVEYVQLQINYMDWENPAVQSRKCYEIATRHKKPIIVMEPIKGGKLANVLEDAEKLFHESEPNMSVASWAIRFTATHDNILTVLSGMSNEEQMKDNLSYMMDFKPLDKEEMQLIKKVTEIIKKSLAIPCTTCRYCVDSCPKEICISDYFTLYNNIQQYGNKQMNTSLKYYNYLTKTHGKASDCIECGLCEHHCPQKLTIRKYLKDVAAIFEIEQ